jgi:hypothetical protein
MEINAYVMLLASFGAWIILAQLARLGWYTVQRVAIGLSLLSSGKRYKLEVAERLRRYV